MVSTLHNWTLEVVRVSTRAVEVEAVVDFAEVVRESLVKGLEPNNFIRGDGV